MLLKKGCGQQLREEKGFTFFCVAEEHPWESGNYLMSF